MKIISALICSKAAYINGCKFVSYFKNQRRDLRYCSVLTIVKLYFSTCFMLAGIAQLVEYKLPKLGVASSNLVARSMNDRLFH